MSLSSNSNMFQCLNKKMTPKRSIDLTSSLSLRSYHEVEDFSVNTQNSSGLYSDIYSGWTKHSQAYSQVSGHETSLFEDPAAGCAGKKHKWIWTAHDHDTVNSNGYTLWQDDPRNHKQPNVKDNTKSPTSCHTCKYIYIIKYYTQIYLVM